jgi:SAM-dependent methyltransferase
VPAKRRAEREPLGRAADAGALAHYDDPAYYDKAYGARRKDVDWYVDLARRTGGPVLEYGVGNGRIAIAMARAGIQVVGVDLSRPMLRSLRERLQREPVAVRRRVLAVRGDMRSVRLRRRFALVIAAFNTLLHLYEREDFERFLAAVRTHLARGGRFAFDISVPQPADLGRDPERLLGAPRFRHPASGAIVRYAERFHYDPLRQVLLVTMDFTPENGDKAWSVPLTHRQIFPQELTALLHYNGFRIERALEDFDERPPSRDVDSLVVVCRASPRRAGLARRARQS